MEELYGKFSRLLAATAVGTGKLPDIGADDWQALGNIAVLHNLQTTLFYAAKSLPQEQQPPREMLDSLLSSTKAAILLDARQQMALEEIQKALKTGQIRALTLKGGLLKAMYAKPEMRFASDIDLWVNPDDRQKLHDALTQLGFTEMVEDAYTRDGNVKVETHYCIAFHNRHSAWTAFFAAMQQAVLAQPPCTLTPEQHYLYLLCHYMMHFQSSGIGLRQTLDLWCYRRRFTLDETYLHGAYETLGITAFAGNLERMLRALFENGETDDITEEMIAYVFSSGMFGKRQYSVSRQLASNGGKGRYLKKRLFPALSEMQRQYPTLRKAPVLLPVFWIWRAVYGVFCKKDHIKKELQATRSASLQQAEQLVEFNRRVGIPEE